MTGKRIPNQQKLKGKPKAQRQRGSALPTMPQLDTLTTGGAKFAGSWIGQTMGYDKSPAHIWEIKAQGMLLTVESRWEGEAKTSRLGGFVMIGEDAFRIGDKKAVLVDPQHFWVEGWDTNDVRGRKGPDYDVVFSRPGLAELSAEAVYKKIKA